MRALFALALVVGTLVACGGGATTPPVQATPAVTSAPSQAPNATPAPTGGYDYGY